MQSWVATRRSLKVGTVLAVLAGAIIGCDDAPASEQSYLDLAAKAYEKGELKAGIIHLKNAVKAYPESSKSRLALGRVYSKLGNAKPAEKELLRAKKLGAAPEEIQRPLAVAWLNLRKFDDVLKETKVALAKTPEHKAAVLALRAKAKLGKGDPTGARAGFNEALKIDPKNLESLVGLSRMAMAERKLDEASRYLLNAQAIDKSNLDVQLLDGELAFSGKDFAKAEKLFMMVRDANKENMLPILKIAETQFAMGKMADTAETLDGFLKHFANHGGALYLRAMAAYRLKDYRISKELTERILLSDEFDQRSLLLAGFSNFAMGELETAKLRLSRFLTDHPKHDGANRMLGLTHIRLNENKAGVALLESLISKYPQDLGVILGLAVANAKMANFAQSEKYYRDAMKLKPKDQTLAAQLNAVIAAKTNQARSDKLNKLAEKGGPAKRYVDFAKALSGKDYTKAQAIAKEQQIEFPQKASGFVMEALVYLAQKKVKEGRDLLSKALILEPGSQDAALNLAKLEMSQKKNETARKILEESWNANPKGLRVLQQLVALDMFFKEPDIAIGRLNEAVKNNPKNQGLVLALSKAYIRKGDGKAAIATMETFLVKNPDNVIMLNFLAKTLVSSNRAKDAVPHFAKLVELTPGDAKEDARMRLARVYLAAGDDAMFLGETKSVIDGNAKCTKAKIARIGYFTLKKKFDNAHAELNNFLSDHPADRNRGPLSIRLAMAEEKFADAVSLADKYLAEKHAPARTLHLFKAGSQWRMEMRDAAVQTMNAWLKEAPKDGDAWTVLAGYFMKMKDMTKASEAYKKTAELAPRSWIANNNYAFILMEQGKIKEAQKYIDIAMKSAGNRVGVLHTAGLISMAAGNLDKAVEQLGIVAKSAPQGLGYQFDYARALAKSGKKADAKAALQKVLDGKPSDELKAKVEKLQATLK